MSKPVITVENLSKSFTLQHQQPVGGYLALRDVLTDKVKSIFKPGKNRDSTTELFWALKDVSFEVNQGDRIGIIGRNGAGKSTLLKILSRIVAPTQGKITIQGRVASLLEVGTGFHPELTGRENIFLNGAILGMNKAEIKSKFDEIVDFSGVEKFLDTPVKRFSSGMYVRLAFAVAAHLEPEILIIDEVLAVGDAEFQKKCLGKMDDVSKSGRTLLFVSHNMGAIQQLCSKCLLLDQGKLIGQDTTANVVKKYLSKSAGLNTYIASDIPKSKIFLQSLFVNNENILDNGKLALEICIESQINEKVSIDFRILTASSIPVGFGSLGTFSESNLVEIKKGQNKLNVLLNMAGMAVGDYVMSLDITKPDVMYYERVEDCVKFEVPQLNSDDRRQLNQSWNYGCMQIDAEIKQNRIQT